MKFRSNPDITFNRHWSMPSAWTFHISPIATLISRYVPCAGSDWIDLFAGKFSPAEFTNDMHSERDARWHMEALDFCKQIPSLTGRRLFEGVLFDPPYSNRQISEHYKGLGK